SGPSYTPGVTMTNVRPWLASLALLISARLPAADPTPIATQVHAWRVEHEKDIVEEFCSLLAIPNVASDTPNIQRNARRILAMLEKRGLTTKLLALRDAPPIVVGDLVASPRSRTIAFYAHYDGQPVDAAKWKSDPWKPRMRASDGRDVDWRRATAIDPEWRLYARGA